MKNERTRRTTGPINAPIMPPATTPEGREKQLIDLAMMLVEQRIRDGSASAQETVHFLREGSVRAQTEREILKEQKKLVQAKTEALEAAKRLEETQAEILAALRKYSGYGGDEEDYENVTHVQ